MVIDIVDRVGQEVLMLLLEETIHGLLRGLISIRAPSFEQDGAKRCPLQTSTRHAKWDPKVSGDGQMFVLIEVSDHWLPT